MRVLLLTLWKPSKGGVVTHVEQLINHSENEFTIITYPPVNIPFLRAFSFLFFGFLKGMRRRFDIIHAHYAVPQGLLGAMLKKLKGTPLVVTLHGSDITVLGKGRVTRFLLGFVLKEADRIIAVSEFLKREALALGALEEKTRVIYGGVEVGSHRGRLVERKKGSCKVLYIGALVRHKGVDFLLRAFKWVSERRRGCRLLIVGDGAEKDRLMGLRDELEVETEFCGYVDDISGILRESDVLVLPSRDEGFGLVLLEAMAAGLPVVATRVGGIPEIVRHNENGLLVERGDVNALADAILKVLEDEDLRNRLVEGGLKTVERFSWSRMAGEVDEVYRELSKKSI